MNSGNADKTGYEDLLKKIERITAGQGNRDDKLSAVCKLLADNISHYDWVGFYLTEESGKNELVLGPFVGKPTEHVRIPFGKGICGQAAERKVTFVVQDVSKEDNYLSCSPDVRSEIVVPILKDGEVRDCRAHPQGW
jgi:GAF domain-containing protein